MKTLVVAFLKAVGVQNIEDRGEGTAWIRASCPLAPWTHVGGVDVRPSFGVKVEEGKEPYYHCFVCSSGSLHKLLHLLQWFREEHLVEASRLFGKIVAETEDDEEEGAQRPRRRVIVDRKFLRITERRIDVPREVPKSVLDRLPLIETLPSDHEAVQWLVRKRGISLEVIARYGLRLYEDRLFCRTGVVFPLVAKSGAVLDLWVRMIDEKRFFRLSPQLLDSPSDYGADWLWFGDHLVNVEAPVVVTEGALDALRLATLGVRNAVASMGTPSHHQIAAFHARVVYVAFDADEAGRRMAKRFIESITVPIIYYVDWGKVGIKDAGDLQSRAQLEAALRQRVCLVRVSKKYGKKTTSQTRG